MIQTKSKTNDVDLEKSEVVEKKAKPEKNVKVVEVDPRQSTCILNGNSIIYTGAGVKSITLNVPFQYGKEAEK